MRRLIRNLQEEQKGQEVEEEVVVNNDFIDILTISMDSTCLRDWVDFEYTGLNIVAALKCQSLTPLCCWLSCVSVTNPNMY